MSSPLSINFLAGCINRQLNLNKEAHYHHLLSATLKIHQIDAEINLSQYHSYNLLVEKVKKTVHDFDQTCLCVFIRPYPYYVLCKPLIKYFDNKFAYHRTLHPALFQRQLIWPDIYSMNYREISVQPQYGLPVRIKNDLNLIAGKLLLLDRWALHYVRDQFIKISQIAIQEGIDLIIVSPTRCPVSRIKDLAISRLHHEMRDWARDNGHTYIDIFSFCDDSF